MRYRDPSTLKQSRPARMVRMHGDCLYCEVPAMTPDPARQAAMEPQDAAFGASETLVATLHGTMMCLLGRGVNG